LTTSYLGTSGYGEFAIVLAFIEIVSIVSDAGIPTILVREVTKAPERVNEIAASLFRVRLALSALVVLACLALLPFLPYESRVQVGLVLGLVAAISTRIGMFPTQLFQVQLRFTFLASLDIIARVSTLALTILVVSADLGFQALVGAQIGTGVVILALSFYVTRGMWQLSARPDWQLARRLMREALPIGMLAISSLVHYKGDAILLSLFQPVADVGLYAIAFRLFDLGSFMPAFFIAAVFPILTRYLHDGDRQRAADVMRRALNFLLLASCPLVIVLIAFAGPLIELVAGPGFEDAAGPLRLLAPGLLFTFATMLFANLLVVLNRQRALLLVSVAGVLINIGANLYCIPRWSYMGAAATTVACEALGLLAIFLIARHSCRMSTDLRFIARLTAACLAMVFAILLLRNAPALVSMPVAGLVFAATAFGLRAVTPADLRMLRPAGAQ
jgi:O-antigen/teichoic acid export membrane protein